MAIIILSNRKFDAKIKIQNFNGEFEVVYKKKSIISIEKPTHECIIDACMHIFFHSSTKKMTISFAT